MEIFEDIKIDQSHSNIPLTLSEQIKEMEEWTDFLENESIVYQRRLWKNFMDMVCCGHIIERLKTAFGADEVQRVIDNFLRLEKPTVMRKQIEMAKNGNWSGEFMDIEGLFSENNIGG